MSCGCEVPYVGPSLAYTCYGGSFILFMSLLDGFIRQECDVSEICERVKPIFAPDEEYDFVVIGGGAAGAVVAGRLSENPNFKVLLIEAGGDEPPGSQVPSMMANFLGNRYLDWNYKTEPQNKACLGFPERRCVWPRGKVLGGSGVLHGMMYMRGLPKDYDTWEEMGNPGWNFKSVTRVFKLSEGNVEVGSLVDAELHGTEGPMTTSRFPDHPALADDIMKAAEELGYSFVTDLNKKNYTGFTIAQTNNINGTRLSSARAYLRPARNRPNFHVMINSTATKVILESNNCKKYISKVEFIYENRSYSVKVKKEAIISAGAVNSPHILLLSGIGPKKELDKVNITQVHNLPGVGKNLQNHVSFGIKFSLNNVTAVDELSWLSVHNFLHHRKGPMTSTGMAQVTGRLTTIHGDDSYPDLQMFFGGFLANCSRKGAINESDVPGNPIFEMSPVVLRPKSRGYIGLKTTNPLAPPLMQPNYLTNIYDVKLLIAGIRIAQKFEKTTALKKYGATIVRQDYGNCAEKFSYDSDEFWECAVRYETKPENHQSSSCKMGPSSDPMAVVDSKLRVHGIKNLRVVDASIMPFVVSGNPHASIVMIAEKGVESIRRTWTNH